MPHKLKFFAFFSVLALLSASWAAEHPKAKSMSSTFTVMGDIRWRYEFRDNADFDGVVNDAMNFHLARARVGVQAEATENTWGFVQFQDARYWGEEASTYDGTADNFDVHQAFIKVEHLWGTNFGLKIGRQELSYGDERLVGADGWNNLGQSFDGAKLTFTSEHFDFDAFYTQHVPYYPEFTSLNPAEPPGGPFFPTSGNITFSGFYGTAKLMENMTWDGYVLLGFDGNPSPDKTWLWTIGTRASGTVAEQLDYSGEFAFQTGNVGAVDQSAFALALKAGYTFPVDVEPRVGVELAMATGEDGTGTSNNTFIPLFPSPHGKFGAMDYQDWSNMINLGLKFSVKPAESIKLKAGFNFFKLDEETDFWYQPYGNTVGLGGTSSTIGSELDLGFYYDYNDALGFMAGFSHFFPGERLDQAAAPASADASDWITVGTNLRF